MLNRLAIPRFFDKMFDPDGNVERIRSYIEKSQRRRFSGAGAIIGSYGFGKTHFLKHLEHVYSSSKKVLPIYVSSPGRSFLDLYNAVMRKLLKNRMYKEIALRVINDKIAITPADSSETYEYFYYLWLLGEKLDAKIRRKLGLTRNLDVWTSLEMLTQLILEGDKLILILLDEFETILELKKYKRLSYMNALRRLIDDASYNLFMLVASTPAGWDEIVSINMALSRRLSAMLIYLRNLTKNEVLEFLRIYLPEVASFLPESVVDRLYDYTNGNPGEILRLTAIIYDEIYLRNGKIDPEEAIKAISLYA
ncbi:MAG: DUF2791 family P-loop domain-containing protein [archaeon GB-1867-005]|nr:DUF2791 family P-loop domain-containing protein [Candidatus Culexmicrobium cathedralense]